MRETVVLGENSLGTSHDFILISVGAANRNSNVRLILTLILTPPEFRVGERGIRQSAEAPT